jgi:hypothetical protein
MAKNLKHSIFSMLVFLLVCNRIGKRCVRQNGKNKDQQ